ncbi:MAG: PBP1A family penicillin-binding protein [Hyphomicrobiales bacterium]|nr:PBP1A family penicillin-binding protein [Hyphomicrobiales bacterium]
MFRRRNTRRGRNRVRIEPTFESAPKRGGRRGQRPVRGRVRGNLLQRLVRRLVYWGTVTAVWAALIFGGITLYYGASLPPIADLKIPARTPNIVMVAATGETLATRGTGPSRDVRLRELPVYLPQAIIAVEDRRFRWHPGVDPIGLIRATIHNLRAGRIVEGGSTLTQQLAKNLFLEPDRTLRRKVQEMILALWLEWHYSKDQILELYLNRVYFGAGTYGVEAAAQRFFGKSARQATLPQAAVLAGLLKAPARYAPTRNPGLAEDRASLVIERMVAVGFISPSEGLAAIAHPAAVRHPNALGAIDYAADWIADQLPGFIGQPATDIVVETTIDPKLQADAEAALTSVLDEQGSSLGASQGAVVAIDPNGAVKALVGGRSYFESQFNRATKAFRQPGSAFKPFIYLAALERGLTPDTVRLDAPVKFANWSPKNYDDKYRGPVTLREGLTNSLNTVAARLANEVGVKSITDTARRLGITAPISRNLSIALGTSEVSLLELTGAYVPFSNGGFGVLPHVIERVRTADGKLLYQRSGSGPGRVVRREDVGAMNHMLQAALNSGTAQRAALGTWPAAGKTGTTQDWRDAWFIGYTARLTAGVWIGNDDGTPMKRVTGGSLPAMAWNRFMVAVHQGLNPVPLPGNYWRNPDRAPPLAAVGRRDDAARPLSPEAAPRQEGSGFSLDGSFLKRIFGG